MLVKKLDREELFDARRAMAVAFESSFDTEKEREALKKPEDPSPEIPRETWGAFSEDGKTLFGCFDLGTYQVRFDGAILPLGGVGGVATLPPYRRRGAIRACMQSAFQSMYERAYAFSFLYPFSTAYYRQFGYENGGPLQTWTVPISSLTSPAAGGSIEQLFPGDSLSPLLEVYQNYCENFNLSVLRKEYDPALSKEDLMAQKRYIYLWRDEAGRPRSFLIYHGNGNVFDCTMDFSMKNGLLFSDARSLQALLHFVKTSFLANYESIRFTTPGTLNILSLLPEMSGTPCRWFPNGMVRIVHLKKVLSHCRCKGEGALILQVEDPLLKENRGIWRLTFAPGKENLVEKAEGRPDLSLGIGDLSALLCGIRTGEELPWMPGVTVQNHAAPFSQVFYRKHCWMLDLF